MWESAQRSKMRNTSEPWMWAEVLGQEYTDLSKVLWQNVCMWKHRDSSLKDPTLIFFEYPSYCMGAKLCDFWLILDLVMYDCRSLLSDTMGAGDCENKKSQAISLMLLYCSATDNFHLLLHFQFPLTSLCVFVSITKSLSFESVSWFVT